MAFGWTKQKELPSFSIAYIEAELRNKTINISRADELSSKELTGNYFDLLLKRPEGIRLRYGNEIGLILEDGTIRHIVRNGELEKAINTFKLLIGIAKKMTEFDEEKESFNFDLVSIPLFQSKRGAVNTISDFIGKDKVDVLSKVLGESISASYIGVYLREFGKPVTREYMDIDIEPYGMDVSKYWIKIRYNLRDQKGINKLQEYISEMIIKTNLIVKFLEGEE